MDPKRKNKYYSDQLGEKETHNQMWFGEIYWSYD
jgi:hypothetical protein